MKGRWVVVEGLNAAGKTTLMDGIKEYLHSKEQSFTHSREPGSSIVGERIRSLLLDGKESGLQPITEVLLFAAARHQHIVEVIEPGLRTGKYVLCDRYLPSSISFQGYGQGISLAVIKKINDEATVGLVPDLTIILDIDPELAAERIAARKGEVDKYEGYDMEFQKRVRQGYLDQASNPKIGGPGKFVVIDASQSPTDILSECIGWLKHYEL
ncbi:MAG: dTMP kinase [Methylophilus sp.]|uniref:dTMP kinase n=1 Tax=Methylophilus sp. TaxID=29541 RepID=UPI003F9F4ED0